jgi:hypothetical protein
MFKTIAKAVVLVCGFIGAGFILRMTAPEFAYQGFWIPRVHYFMTWGTVLSLCVVGVILKMRMK